MTHVAMAFLENRSQFSVGSEIGYMPGAGLAVADDTVLVMAADNDLKHNFKAIQDAVREYS